MYYKILLLCIRLSVGFKFVNWVKLIFGGDIFVNVGKLVGCLMFWISGIL